MPSDETTAQDQGSKSESLWSKSARKFMRDRFGIAALIIVGIYAVVALGVWFGIWAQDWSSLSDTGYEGISTEHWFGTNINGQDIFQRTIAGTKTAFEVGLLVAVISTLIGCFLGAVAGFYNGTFIDEIIMWLYGCIDAIPFLLFVAALAFALEGTVGSSYTMHIAMIATFWSGTCRIVRGEVIKIRNLEYIQAAHAIGVKPMTIIFRHVMPNTFHILLVQGTIAFVGAIKSEVILTFLGIGIKDGVSWGLMLSESTGDVLRGHFGNFLAASGFLFVLVIAFNMFADALQDATDPRKISN